MTMNQGIIIAIAVYVVAATGVGLYAFLIKRASLFDPIGQYLVWLSLFTLPLPIRATITLEAEGNVSPHISQFAAYLPVAVLLTAVSLPLFAGAYYSRVAAKLGDRIPLLAARSIRGTRAGIGLLVLISIMLIALLARAAGGIIPFLLLGYNSSRETFGRGYLAVGFPWLVVAAVALLDRYIEGRRWIDFVGFGIAVGVNTVLQVVMGNRAMLTYLGVVLIVFAHHRIRAISAMLLAPVAAAAFIALNILGTVRGSDYEGPGEFVERVMTSGGGVADDRSSLFYTLTIGEFVVPFETLPQMIRTVGITERPWFGLSYLRAPVYVVPSAVLPSRPLPLTTWYMNKFYGGSGGLNEGRGFFFLSEAYLNLGPLGVGLVSLAWGVLWGALHRWMLRGRDRLGTVLVYALLVGFMFRAIAGDFVSLLVGAMEQSLVAVMIILGVASVLGARKEVHVRHGTPL